MSCKNCPFFKAYLAGDVEESPCDDCNVATYTEEEYDFFCDDN